MAKSLKQIIEIVEKTELSLRKLDAPKIVQGDRTEIDLSLDCSKGVREFLIDFLYCSMKIYEYEESFLTPLSVKRRSYSGTVQQKRYPSDIPYLCHAKARRSIGDLFRITLAYYSKDITLFEVMEEMYNIVQQEIRINCKTKSSYFTIYQSICTTIHRRVFNTYPGSSRTSYKFNKECNHYLQESDLDEEFFILGQDYTTLFETEEGKTFMKNIKEKRKAPIREVVDLERLDELVFAKLKQMKLEFA